MSDTPQGPDWWQASDGKWYPPEQTPGGGAAGGGGGVPGTLDVGTALSYGWNKFVQYIGPIILIVVIIFAVQLVVNFVSQIVYGTIDSFFVAFTVGGLLWAAGWFINLMLQAGLIRAGLAITRGEEPEIGMLFKTDNLGPYAVASILAALLYFVGFLACCVGMLVVALFLIFYGFYSIDRGQSVDALRSSFEVVRNNLSSVLVFAIVVVVLNLITCGLATGVTFIATAYAYRVLNGESVAA